MWHYKVAVIIEIMKIWYSLQVVDIFQALN